MNGLRKYGALLGVMLCGLGLVSCQVVDKNSPTWRVNKKLYEQADATKTKVEVSLWDQQAWLLDEQGRVILKTDVSTGVPGKETPVGEFHVLEKLKQKRSNKYGKYVHRNTGEVLIEKNWLHKGPLPKAAFYQGTEMPYWMRLTWYGVGMHVGKFTKRTRCSFGCIRVFEEAQPWIYEKTDVGTKVTIHEKSLLNSMAEKEDFSWIQL